MGARQVLNRRCERLLHITRHSGNAAAVNAWVEPTDFEYGERQYIAADPVGHQWTFSETLADLTPEEWAGNLSVRNDRSVGAEQWIAVVDAELADTSGHYASSRGVSSWLSRRGLRFRAMWGPRPHASGTRPLLSALLTVPDS